MADLDEVRVELVRARGFVRAAETQFTKTLDLLDEVLVGPEPEPEPEPEPPEPEPEPIPWPHPAVPPIEDDPEQPDAVRDTHLHHTYPKAITFEALGNTEYLVVVLESDQPFNDYLPVKLPDGRIGLWGVSQIFHDQGMASLDPSGPWLHIGPGAAFEWDLAVGQIVDDQGNQYVYELDGLPYLEWTEWDQVGLTPSPVSLASITAGPLVNDPPPEPDEEIRPENVGTPGQPQFLAMPEGGATVRWGAAVHATGYEVRGAGFAAQTTELEFYLDHLEVGDWVCVHAMLGEEVLESGHYRCNSWRIS